jgi:hypothetical protein
LRGLLSYRQVRAELAAAADLGALLLRHAESSGADPALRVQAHYGHGVTLYHLGKLDAARAHLEQALAAYDPATHGEHMRVYGGYMRRRMLDVARVTLALMGRLEEAAIRSARRRSRPPAGATVLAGWAYCGASTFELIFGDYIASATAAADAERLAEEHGFPYVLGMAMANRGWAAIRQGDPAAGIPILRDGVAAIDATGAALVRPQYLGMLAAADAIEGRFEGCRPHRRGPRRDGAHRSAPARVQLLIREESPPARKRCRSGRSCAARSRSPASGTRLLEPGPPSSSRDIDAAVMSPGAQSREAHAWFRDQPATKDLVARAGSWRARRGLSAVAPPDS